MITKQNAKEMQALSTKARSENAAARKSFETAMRSNPDMIPKLIANNADAVGNTKLCGEYLLNTAQSIFVQSVLEEQRQAHKIELENLKSQLKSNDVLEIHSKPDLTDVKRAWSLDELVSAYVLGSVSSREILTLFCQNKAVEPPSDEQNKLLAVWHAYRGSNA